MNTLYDCGYQEIKSLEKMVNLVKALDAVLVDIRYSPNSRNPQWGKKTIEEKLGLRYFHLRNLGNKNFRGGPTEFVDLQDGISTVARLLQERNVILMCACSVRDQCHRLEFAHIFEKEYGLKSIQLTDEKAKEIIDTPRQAPTQLSLF